jgi:hypothetical protein
LCSWCIDLVKLKIQVIKQPHNFVLGFKQDSIIGSWLSLNQRVGFTSTKAEGILLMSVSKLKTLQYVLTKFMIIFLVVKRHPGTQFESRYDRQIRLDQEACKQLEFDHMINL